MSTRSTIAIRRGPASIESIYCHFDGYPDGVGSKLISHYNSIEKVEALIRLGNVSCLREEAGDPDAKDPTRFNTRPASEAVFYGIPGYRFLREDPHPTWTVAYGRDFGEVGQEAKVTDHGGFRALCESRNSEWVYLWQDGGWHFSEGPHYDGSIGKWEPLTSESIARRS